MEKTFHQWTLSVLFIFGLGFASGADAPPTYSPLDINIQEGEGSILLSWEIPDTIMIQEIRLYKKTSYLSEFNSFELLDPKLDRYLDTNCIEGDRYFYYLEILDVFGRVLSSPSEHTVFGTCLETQLELFQSRLPESLPSFVKQKQNEWIHTIMPHLTINTIQSFIDMIHLDKVTPYAWLEQLPLNDLPLLENDFSQIHNVLGQSFLLDSMEVYKKSLQNHFMLFDDEWEDQIGKLEEHLLSNMNHLNDIYSRNLTLLGEMSPARLVNIYQENGHQYTSILIIREQDIYWDELLLMNGDTYINISYQDSLAQDQTIRQQIPNEWVDVSLIHRGERVQFIPIKPDVNHLNISWRDELYVTHDMIPWKVELNPESCELNELSFSNSLFQIEILINTPDFTPYEFWVSEQPVFEWTTPIHAESAYIDTFFSFDARDTSKVHWARWVKTTDLIPSNEYVEWIPIFMDSNHHMAKYPDGGRWETDSDFTFGRSNVIETSYEQNVSIPELFVLYQNFPNPFNAETRISFDLLEESMVSLFIFDANGRIIEQFLDKELLQPGAFFYSWNADNHPTGIYFFTIQAMVQGLEPVTFSRKMIYLK